MPQGDPRIGAQALTIRQSDVVLDVAADGGRRMVYRFDNRNNYGAPRIENILFLGGSRIFDVASGGNPEKVVLRNIRGAFTHTAVRMPWATDIPSVNGLFMNANSLYRFIEQFGGPMPQGMTSWEYASRMNAGPSRGGARRPENRVTAISNPPQKT